MQYYRVVYLSEMKGCILEIDTFFCKELFMISFLLNIIKRRHNLVN